MRQFAIADCRFAIGVRAIFSVVLVLAFLAVPFASDAQQPGKIYRIGWHGITRPAATHVTPQVCFTKGGHWQAFLAGLREHGYLPGQTLVTECRWTEGRTERAPALAAELVSLKPDLLVAFSTANVRAAKQATSTIPIVMLGVIDPVGRGLVPSLAHPGGNVTGLTDQLMEMEGKRLQLLKEAVPTVSRVAALKHPGGSGLPPGSESVFDRTREAAARALDITLQYYDIREPADFEGAFAAITRARAEALFMTADPFWYSHRHRIIELAAKHRLPAMYNDRDLVPLGGLLAYDVDQRDIFRRLGFYVDRILKGAKPGDLPVEQPTKLDLLINLKTAKALGLTIPQSLVMRADEVIE